MLSEKQMVEEERVILTSPSLRLPPHTSGETIGVFRAKGIDPCIVVVSITGAPHGGGFCSGGKENNDV